MEAQAAPKSDFYVYALLRADGVTPFYIGKGRGNRINCHTIPRDLVRKSVKNSIIRKVVAEVGHLPRHKIYEGLTEAESFILEGDLITMLGRRDRLTGILANLTEGGEGLAGFARSPKQLAALAANNEARWARPGEPERLAEASAARWAEPEYRNATGAAISAAILANPAEREKRSARNSKRWDDPEFRVRVGENIAKSQADPAVKAVQSEKRRALWADPEFKARASLAIKAGMARRKAGAAG